MTSVFLSYDRSDYSFAHRLIEALRGVNVEGWMDSADISAGKAVSGAVRSGIRNANAVLVLVSPKSLDSRWINFEMGVGLALGRPILPILIEGRESREDLPEPLRGFQAIDARNRPTAEVAREIEKVLSTLNSHGGEALSHSQ